MERQLIKASAARKASKSGGRARAKASTTKKRPAAAADMKKRPSAITTFSAAALRLERTIDLKDVFKLVKKCAELDQSTPNRNKVTSIAYSRGVKRALETGIGKDVAKEYGRMQLSKASAVWAKHHGS